MKILVIEDDPIISETVTICFNLRWPEAEVITTDSDEQGLKLATASTPDVIILDVGLPGIDGYENPAPIAEHHRCAGHNAYRQRRGSGQGKGAGIRSGRLYHQALQPY